MYIQTGGVKLSVINEDGKEAVVAILGPGDFFGEGCLAAQPVCMATSTAMVPTSILFIEKNEMMRVLRTEHGMSDLFISHLLAKNIRVEQDLIDQLFNSSEKRLARATVVGTLRYGGPTSRSAAQSIARTVGRNDRHNAFTSQFLHE